MSRTIIKDLSIERTLEENEATEIVGAGGFSIHIGHRGGRVRWRGRGRHFHHHYRRPRFHDTSHWDYYPGGLECYGDGYRYVPGHYHYHRSGHWHY